MEWSVDCDHILCALYERLTVQVFSLIDPEWFCRVQEGTSGLQSASWSPTGYHILTVAEFSVSIHKKILINVNSVQPFFFYR